MDALGKIETADEAGIRAALTDKFPDLNQNEITITMGDWWIVSYNFS
jgi:hypothetical protein